MPNLNGIGCENVFLTIRENSMYHCPDLCVQPCSILELMLDQISCHSGPISFGDVNWPISDGVAK